MYNQDIELENFQRNIPIRLISTLKSDLKTCHESEKISEIISNNTEDYDNFPVVNKSNGSKSQIIGLLNVKKSTDDNFQSSTVREKMEHLSEKNLIGADASILSYIESAESVECRLLVSGPDISGMVCVSDLQKIPVRSAVFALITNLEQIMSKFIEYKMVTFKDWEVYIELKKINSMKNKIKESKLKNTFVNELLFADFNVKISIIDKIIGSDELRRDFKNELHEIYQLRNKMYHANNYAHTTKECKHFIAVVALCQKWSTFFTGEISARHVLE